NCALKAQCTKGPQRRITRWEHEYARRVTVQVAQRAPRLRQGCVPTRHSNTCSNGRVDVDRHRLRALSRGGKTFSHGLDPNRTKAASKSRSAADPDLMLANPLSCRSTVEGSGCNSVN